jgi:hypothetical protein
MFLGAAAAFFIASAGGAAADGIFPTKAAPIPYAASIGKRLDICILLFAVRERISRLNFETGGGD